MENLTENGGFIFEDFNLPIFHHLFFIGVYDESTRRKMNDKLDEYGLPEILTESSGKIFMKDDNCIVMLFDYEIKEIFRSTIVHEISHAVDLIFYEGWKADELGTRAGEAPAYISEYLYDKICTILIKNNINLKDKEL